MPRFKLPAPATWMPLTVLGLGLGYAISILTRLPWWSFLPCAVAFVWLGRRVGTGQVRYQRYRKVRPWSLLPLCLWGLYIYLADSFGDVDIAAVFFHLQAGMEDHGGSGRLIAAVLYTLFILAMLISITWLARNDWRWRRSEPFIAVLLLASNPLLYSIGQRSAVVVADDHSWLDRRYVTPDITSQSSPPNLLIMYLESIERTYSDPRFGDAYADLEHLGEQGVVFEGIKQIDNTGWTMAGMIASQCGSPLMPAGLLHDRQFEPLSTVVPGVDCLGDLLSEQGYQLSFLGGASTEFAGKGLFYQGHGFEHVYGFQSLQSRLKDPEYTNDWGLYDDTLYDLTLEEIERLDRETDGPWGVVNLNITGHAPNGYPAQRCINRQGEWDGIDILYSVECSAWLARDLIERLEQRGLLENTVVAILSDHLTMRVSVWDELTTMERDNTFILLGSDHPPQRIRRNASTMDIFPTLLDAMGYVPKDSRAGLGVSLLSNTETLLERYSAEDINDRLHAESSLQQRLWEGLAPQQQSSTTKSLPANDSQENPKDIPEELPIIQ
ncbi:sulfatase-like hydrolase/transferase [Vreelandella aquamarina]